MLCHRFVRWQRQPSGFATGQGFSAAVTVAYCAQTAEFCHSMVAPSTSFATLDISRIRIATVSWIVYEPRRSRSNGVQYYHRYSAPPPIGERSIVINLSVCVCVCVCLSVRDHIFGTTRPIFTNFLCMLPTAVARSSSDGAVICYVGLFPVLWTTLYLHIS